MPEGIDARAAMEQAAQNDLVQRKIQMDALRARLGDGRDEKAKLRESCEGFESIFLQKMWEQMRKNVSKEGYLHSKDEEAYQSMFDVELCKKMTSAGGIGLADMLYEQLSQKLDHAGRATTPTGYRGPVATPAAPTSQPAAAQAGKAPVEKLTAENLYAEAGPATLAAGAKPEVPAAEPAKEPQSLLDAALNELRADVESQDAKNPANQTTEQREQAPAPTVASGSPIQAAASIAQTFAFPPQAVASTAPAGIPPMQASAPATGTVASPAQAGPQPPATQAAFQASSAGKTFVLTPPTPLHSGPETLAAQGTQAVPGVQAVPRTQVISGHQAASTEIPPMMQVFASPAQAAASPVTGETSAAATPQEGNKATPSSRRSGRTDNPRSASWLGHGPVSAEPKPLPRFRRSDADDDSPAPKTGNAAPTAGSASPTPTAGASLPTEGRVVGAFGWGNEPGGQRRWSNGLDIQTAPGAPVRACLDGSVAFVGEQRGLGSVVVLEHADGLRSYYSGVETSGLAQGQKIQRGANFAKVAVQPGSDTGAANSALLHFEIKRGEMALNPENFLGAISG